MFFFFKAGAGAEGEGSHWGRENWGLGGKIGVWEGKLGFGRKNWDLGGKNWGLGRKNWDLGRGIGIWREIGI